jgi:hypothetical protein
VFLAIALTLNYNLQSNLLVQIPKVFFKLV